MTLQAVKLTANDFVRGLLTDPLTGSVPLPGQMAAGAFGGLCQVLFTNPLEIIKIQLQLDGTRAPSPPSPAALVTAAASSSDISIKEHSSSGGSLRLVEVVEGIGFLGLYQGAGICAARDMFFSSMYFPLFSTLKESFATSGHQGRQQCHHHHRWGHQHLMPVPPPFTAPFCSLRVCVCVRERERVCVCVCVCVCE